MFNQKVEKTLTELFLELKDHLKILRDELLLINNGNYEHVKVVASSLRVLICDSHKGNNGGLLVYLIFLTKFLDGIERDGVKISLADYLIEPRFKSSGAKNYELTRCDIIKNEAQQDGLSHAAPKRTDPQFIINAIFEMSKSPKTDLRVGFFYTTGNQILEFGERFLKHHGYFSQ